MSVIPTVYEDLTEEECYLWAILSDHSGIDQAEMCWVDESNTDGCWRAWSFQVTWWRSDDRQQIEQSGRSLGKSMSIMARACAFPFVHPGQEMVVTAPELVHLEPIVSKIEAQMYAVRLYRELLVTGRSGVTHRPFQMNFLNQARIIGRIPQKDGRGVKGCLGYGELVWTDQGLVPVEEIQKGDMVLTHEGRFRPVLAAIHDENDCYEVRGQQSFPMIVSCDHRFFGVDCEDKQFSDPIFVDVEVLDDIDFHWASPTTFPEAEIPETPTDADEDFWWLCGYRLGRSSVDDEVAGWVDKFFRFDHGRQIPFFVLGMSLPHREALFEGFLEDSMWRESKAMWSISVESKKFAVGLQMLAQSLGYKVECSIERTRDMTAWTIHASEPLSEVEHRYGEVTKVTPIGKKPIVNIVVDQDHSYISGSIVSHNLHPVWLEQDECFRAGTLVLTSHGYVPIEDVIEGDEVLTHENRWRPVTSTFVREPQETWTVNIDGATLHATENHKFLTRSEGNDGSLSEPEWVPVRCLDEKSFCGFITDDGEMEDWLSWRSVHSVERTGIIEPHYDLEVEGDHSFIAGGVVVHNSQDYPHAGWVELTETVNKTIEGATWRAHGVTRGVRDDFYKHTRDSPDNPWTVHRYPAMCRPTWTDQERQDKIAQYGGRDDPDYRRNILGLPGDATQALFVASRLFAIADDDITSDYNVDEYLNLKIKSETLTLMDQDILDVVQFPPRHLKYLGPTPSKPKAVYWVGMDIGMTRDPSEILVFVEYRENLKDEFPRLKLLTRINMTRIDVSDQTKVILSVIDFYKPKVFAMDRGGIGLPFLQLLKGYAENSDLQPEWAKMFRVEDSLSRIKGYNFSEKIIVELDPTVDMNLTDNPAKDAGMRRNTKEYGIDKLRELVDNRQLQLPWDTELLGQFQGGTVSSVAGLDQYGRRRFSKGDDHTLDATVMMTLGFKQYSIEEFLAREEVVEPVYDVFISL